MKRIIICSMLPLCMLSSCTPKVKETSMSCEKPNEVCTETGLKYTVLTPAPADAPVATAGQRVTVHYTGWLDDNGKPGTKFDSSVDRGQPFQFALGAGQVIAGWDQGVAGMKVGEKRRLILSPDLAYGQRGAGAVIPPNATLIFDVELLGV